MIYLDKYHTRGALMSGSSVNNLPAFNIEEEEEEIMPTPETESEELDEAARTTRRRTRSRAQNILTSPSGLMDQEQENGSGFSIARRTLLGA